MGQLALNRLNALSGAASQFLWEILYMKHFVKFPIIQLTFTCSKSTIETLGKAIFIINIIYQNIIFGILFLKILFRAYKVFMFVHTFQWTSSEFFLIFRFSRRKSPFWLWKFSSKYDSVWCHKNICTVPFLVAQQPHSWSFLKANVFVFLYISVKENVCSKDVVSFYLMGMGWGEAEQFP